MKRALNEVFADYDLDDDKRAFIRNRVFAMARESILNQEAPKVLEWAEEVVEVVQGGMSRDPTIADVDDDAGSRRREALDHRLRPREFEPAAARQPRCLDTGLVVPEHLIRHWLHVKHRHPLIADGDRT